MRDTVESRYVFAHSIEILYRQDTEVIETLFGVRKPDASWKEADVHGHVHAWIGDELPSLGWHQTGTEWIGDDIEAHEEPVGEYRCLTCGSVVTPKYTTSYEPQYVQGPPSYFLRVLPGLMSTTEYRIPDDDVTELVEIFKRIFDPGE
jgi:hypothetical protein